MVSELSALICLAEARVVVVSTFYPGNATTFENKAAFDTYDAALGVTFIGLIFSMLTFVSARLIRNEALNLVQCARHTLSAILNFMVYYRVWHPIRVWHIWIWFSMIPVTIEFVLVVLSYRRGTWMF